MGEWIAVAAMLVLAGAFLGPFFWSLHIATIPIPPDQDGWILVTPTMFDHVMGIGMVLLTVLFWIVAPMVFLGEASETGSKNQLYALLGMVFGAMFVWHFVYNYLSRIKFNTERLEYSAFRKHISVCWYDVEMIKIGTNGPKVIAAEGNFNVANTRRGFYQLIEMARTNGVSVEDSPYLKSPNVRSTRDKEHT